MNVKLTAATKLSCIETDTEAYAVDGDVVCSYSNAVIRIRHTENGLEMIAQSSSYAAPTHLVLEDIRTPPFDPNACKTCGGFGTVMTEGGRAACECQFASLRKARQPRKRRQPSRARGR